MKKEVIDYCDICQADVDHDGYSECEACHKFYCADHSGHVSILDGEVLCPECFEKLMEKRSVA